MVEVYKRKYYPKGIPKFESIGDFVVENPEPPQNKHEILGWEKKKEDQVWTRTPLPDNWDKLTNNEKLEFAKREMSRRKNGVWVWINGVPTYITGKFYYYLNYIVMQKGHYPDYRDRDRRFFMVWDLVEKDPLCLGMVYPKFRREGATSKAIAIMLEIMTRTNSAEAGIQSQTDTDAKKVFLRLVKALNKMPDFFMPQRRGQWWPKSSVEFFNPSKMITHKNKKYTETSREAALESSIDFRACGADQYDGEALKFYIHDEAGKLDTKHDIMNIWSVVGPCLLDGLNVWGKAFIPSTVGEFQGGGGENFMKLCKASKYKDRLVTGTKRTRTGLYFLFFPAYDGYAGFIGKYGESIIDAPTPEQLKYLRKKNPGIPYEEGVGAKEWLLRERRAYETAGDLKTLSEKIRQYPFDEDEMFADAGTPNSFNTELLNRQKKRLKNLSVDLWQRYKLDWEDGKPFTRVVARPVGPKETGSVWKITHMPDDHDLNQVQQTGYGDTAYYTPLNNYKFAAGCDPFSHNTPVGKGSRCAAYIYYRKDPTVDKLTEERQSWISDNFIVEYLNRTGTVYEQAMDILKTCWFFGCEVFIEMNKPEVAHKFEEWGCGNFLMHRPDNTMSKWSSKKGETGASSSNYLKEVYVGRLVDFLELNWDRIKFLDLLEDMSSFEFKHTQKSDATVGAGFTLMAAMGKVERPPEQMEEEINFFRVWNINTGKEAKLAS